MQKFGCAIGQRGDYTPTTEGSRTLNLTKVIINVCFTTYGIDSRAGTTVVHPDCSDCRAATIDASHYESCRG